MRYRDIIPKVAVMVETSRGYSRDLLRGILRYEVLFGPWELYAIPGGRTEQQLPELPARGKKGIIAHITNHEIATQIINAQLPTVSVFPTDDITPVANKIRAYGEIRCDSAAVGQLAANHLLERNFIHYGFVGELYNADWSIIRCNAFRECIAKKCYKIHVYPTPSPKETSWSVEQYRLSDWLRSLPKPIGIFAATDIRGRRIIEACHKIHIAVPDEVAVLGVDNDELFCETITPRLSSISIDAEHAGYESAALLNQLMHEKKEQTTTLFGPIRAVSRQSTDFYRVDDEMVAKALKFIQNTFAKPIGVTDVVKITNCSRRQLEIKFKKMTKHSIMDEIKKRRLEKVKLFLIDSNLSIENIAALCGFQSKNYLMAVFRKEFNTTMIDFRKLHQIPERK
ncbi:MAG: DNA-binding transcriptional regulator [Planctomycetaceae bacterium]|jgi:LacI family transcriptional regulator|nr:DNA-binding transcriptional regulator [Planctomycetaceae bacterium]